MKQLKSIDDSLETINNKISPQFKIAFISGIILGLAAHAYMFTNKFPNYDDMGINGFGATFRLGRWFLWIIGSVAYHLDFVYSLPWVNGLITLLCIAVSAGLLVELLQIKSKIFCVLIGGCMVVFPSWTATFFFMFTAHFYGVAVLLAVLSIVFANTSSVRWLKYISPLCLACSMGIYQAYLPFVATGYIVLLLLKIFDEPQVEIIKHIKRAFYYLFQLLSAGVIYLVVMKLSLKITGQELDSYKGVNEMGTFSLELLKKFKEIIKNDFFGIFLNNSLEISHNYVLKIMYLVLYVFIILVISLLIIKLIKSKKYIMAVWSVICAALFVIAINSIYLICQDGVYLLMRYAYVWLMILPVCFISRLSKLVQSNILLLTERGLVTALLAGIFSYVHLANAEYFAMQLTYEQAKSYYTIVAMQIKELDGYSADMPVSFVGYDDISDESLYKNQIMEVFKMSGRDEVLAQTYNIGAFMKYYCGFEAEFFDIDVTEHEEISTMPIYPEKGSIKIIDGNVVVKFAE